MKIDEFKVGQIVGYRPPGRSGYDASRYSRIKSMTAARITVHGYDKPLHPGRVHALPDGLVATLEWVERRPKCQVIGTGTSYRGIEPTTIGLRSNIFDEKTLTAVRDDAIALLEWIQSRKVTRQ